MAKKTQAPAAPKPLSPAEALVLARNAEPIQRHSIAEYVPAVLHLCAKGYDLDTAADLIATAAMIDKDTLTAAFLRRMGRV